MADWRASILQAFVPHVARLTLVADPDDLLVEEIIQQGLREQGFEVMRYEESMAFRFAYESRFRARWDRGEQGDLVVILTGDASTLKTLPFDLLQAGRSLSFGLAALFPGLSYPVVAALERADLDPLYQAMAHHPGETMGENPSKDFILRQVFQIAPELIRDTADLLRMLMRRHYRNQRIPPSLDERLIWLLRQRNQFEDWALEEIIPSRRAFFGFLQERWPLFLARLLERLEGNIWMSSDEHVPSYGMRFAGPAILPFDHDDIHVYMDNLFVEGLLKPVPFPHAKRVSLNWVLAGIHHDPEADRKRRLEGLLEQCQALLPTEESRHRAWQQFAQVWGQLTRMMHDPERSVAQNAQETFLALRTRLDTTFQKWMEKRFAGLHNQPAIPPVMLHHIPREMARTVEQGEKIVLVVLDGMAIEQWLVMREVLAEQRPLFAFQEEAVFAWVPTITSLSRQAIFSGTSPLFFPSSLHTTQQEPTVWKRFWAGQGVASTAVGYLKGLGDGPLASLEELLDNPRLRVAGLVVDKIDRIMHGMELGSAGMQSAVRQWTRQGFMAGMLDLLHSRGFQVVLTSDHGNVEATGMGRAAEGVTADVRGERCRIFPDPTLRSAIRERYPDAMAWPAPGLPDGCHPLLAAGRSAFASKGCRIVGHGGIALEEVIVPLIRLDGSRS
ncbi:MAG: BREX-3 system phosphatase PglZ [Magnetococcales bacterium]|nr:BREX-3 system phosphatase PglZ [Magnetococcales bacterium]MBF0115184.1 BREX-3 system phosphatase PglZ [Magnetococcales bacterium]